MTNETVSENERKRTQPSGAEAEGESAGAREESASKKAKLEQEGQTNAEDKRAEQPASKEGDAGKEQTEASIKEGDKKASPIKRGKGSGYSKRDHRGDTRGSGRERATADDGEGDAKTPRLPKRKVCVAFGYCGIGYSGLQINNGVKTIEGDIFEAFCQLGAVSEDNAVNPNKVGLQRAARTDRGVHAAGNLLTLKLILEPPGIGPGELVKHMNGKLPEFIRIWGLTKVENSFNARTNCDSRQYEYLLPTYVFLPPKPGSHMHTMMQSWQKDVKEADGSELGDEYRPTLEYLLDHPFWRAQGNDKTFPEDTAAKKKWRMSMTQLERVRDVFSQYQGSHNFHNFTLGKPFRERSAHRNMIKLTISDPKIINETEWISIKFHGQSFMLHQIRKMIGLLVLIGRSTAPASLIPETYGPARIHVPKAPGLGLLLEEPLFTIYNRRVTENMKRQSEEHRPAGRGDGGVLKEDITFTKFQEEKDAFKNKWIYDRIYKEEEEKHEYVKFLQYLDVLSGDDFEYLNPRGVIPASAILKVGEQVRTLGKKAKEDDKDAPDDVEQESDDDEELVRGNQAELEG